MNHLAHSITKLSHCGEHDNTVYNGSGEEAVLVIFGRGTDFFSFFFWIQFNVPFKIFQLI